VGYGIGASGVLDPPAPGSTAVQVVLSHMDPFTLITTCDKALGTPIMTGALRSECLWLPG